MCGGLWEFVWSSAPGLSTDGLCEHPRGTAQRLSGGLRGGEDQPALLPLWRHRQHRQPHGVAFRGAQPGAP
eukprot:2931479-Pyramimonas_sp.AAC.1